MPVVEVSLPEDVYAEFERMASEEFISEEQAVEELLSLAVDAYQTDTATEPAGLNERFEGAESNLWDTAADPSLEDDTL